MISLRGRLPVAKAMAVASRSMSLSFHVAIGLSMVGADVVRAQKHLQGAASTNELG